MPAPLSFSSRYILTHIITSGTYFIFCQYIFFCICASYTALPVTHSKFKCMWKCTVYNCANSNVCQRRFCRNIWITDHREKLTLDLAQTWTWSSGWTCYISVVKGQGRIHPIFVSVYGCRVFYCIWHKYPLGRGKHQGFTARSQRWRSGDLIQISRIKSEAKCKMQIEWFILCINKVKVCRAFHFYLFIITSFYNSYKVKKCNCLFMTVI